MKKKKTAEAGGTARRSAASDSTQLFTASSIPEQETKFNQQIKFFDKEERAWVFPASGFTK